MQENEANEAMRINPIYYKGEKTTCREDWHFHNILVGFDKFYYIVDGECYIEINGKKFTAKAGQLYFLPVGSTQTLYTVPGKTVTKYWFHCTLPCGDRDFSAVRELPLFIEVKDGAYITDLFKDIIKAEKSTDMAGKLEQKADILKLLGYYLRHCDSWDINTRYDSRVSYIMNYIEENLHRELPLTELCELLHYQPGYLIRFFKTATGTTPAYYIQNRRIVLSQKLLLEKESTIKDVSQKCGFKDPHYFSRYFKRQTGMTPLEYKNMAIREHINKE